jgi:hypothetical protein
VKACLVRAFPHRAAENAHRVVAPTALPRIRFQIDRTTHYRVHARLRNGNITGAQEALTEASGLSERAGSGNSWVAILHANLARLQNQEWTDPVLVERLAAGKELYSAWLYLQATAWQADRGLEDAVYRLQQAVSLLPHQAGEVAGNVCNLFAAFLELNAAVRLEDPENWPPALARARGFLSIADDHRSYYGPSVDTLPDLPVA